MNCFTFFRTYWNSEHFIRPTAFSNIIYHNRKKDKLHLPPWGFMILQILPNFYKYCTPLHSPMDTNSELGKHGGQRRSDAWRHLLGPWTRYAHSEFRVPSSGLTIPTSDFIFCIAEWETTVPEWNRKSEFWSRNSKVHGKWSGVQYL